jgi:hypothetical protein
MALTLLDGDGLGAMSGAATIAATEGTPTSRLIVLLAISVPPLLVLA